MRVKCAKSVKEIAIVINPALITIINGATPQKSRAPTNPPPNKKLIPTEKTKNANEAETDNGSTAMKLAAQEGHANVIETLLDLGCAVHSPSVRCKCDFCLDVGSVRELKKLVGC
jgi:hypothetical protein